MRKYLPLTILGIILFTNSYAAEAKSIIYDWQISKFPKTTDQGFDFIRTPFVETEGEISNERIYCWQMAEYCKSMLDPAYENFTGKFYTVQELTNNQKEVFWWQVEDFINTQDVVLKPDETFKEYEAKK